MNPAPGQPASTHEAEDLSAEDLAAWLEILRWHCEAGMDAAIGENPRNRFAQQTPPPAAAASPAAPLPSQEAMLPAEPQKGSGPKGSSPKGPSPQGSGPKGQGRARAEPAENAGILQARAAAQAAVSLQELRAALEHFDGCDLKRSARSLVFADGNPEARVMLIGEAPGAEEDRQGLPFVGRSGQLLDRMLAAIGLDRSSAYITNILPWRPHGNRNPTAAEIELLRPFIERHIQLAAPELLLLVGGVSAKALLHTTTGILKLRGSWVQCRISEQDFPALPTFHPAYLLRRPADKALAWRDFLSLKQRLAGN